MARRGRQDTPRGPGQHVVSASKRAFQAPINAFVYTRTAFRSACCTATMTKLTPYVDHHVRTTHLLLGALAALALNWAATQWLNASYALSRFPVPYYEAQLSFSHLKLKHWYAQLQGLGTLGQYTTTQVVDFAFIATVLLLHSLALLWASRLLPQASRWYRFMRASVLVAAVAPLADALENLVSFVMLSDPAGFHPAWALLYSSLAALKFAAFSYAYLAFALGLVAAAVYRSVQRRSGMPA